MATGDSDPSEQLALTVGQLPVGTLVLRDGAIAEANLKASQLLGVDPAELLGSTLVALTHPDHRARVEALLAGAEGAAPDAVVRRRADPPAWLELSLLEGPEAMVVTLHDVTEAVRTFRVLRESAWTVTVADLDGRRTWGPVGREHPEDRPGETDTPPSDRVHPEDMVAVLAAFQRAAAVPGRRERVHSRLRDVSRDDGWAQGTVEVANVFDVPELEGILLRLHDRDETESVGSIAQTRSAFQSIAEAAPIGIVLAGPALIGAYFNAAVRSMLPGIGTGTGVRDWTRWVPEPEGQEVRDWVADTLALAKSASRTVRFEVGGDPGYDRSLWAVVTVAPRHADEGGLAGCIVTFQDVSREVGVRRELEQAQEHLVHLASHDPLTGLANRTLLNDALDRIANACRSDDAGSALAGAALGVLFCDLDSFKAVNDEFGHEAGDQVLIEVAERLRRTSRSADLVARLGGDEFLVLAGGSPAELENLAQRIATAVAEPIQVGDRSIRVGVTIGVTSSDGSEAIDAVLKRADAAMYERKRASSA